MSAKKKTRKAQQRSKEKRDAAARPSASPPRKLSWSEVRVQIIVGGAALLGLFVWSYWPTLVELVKAWYREPDYSYGFLVIPLAIMFLWFRQESFPGFTGRIAWGGLAIIGLSIALRYTGALYYLDAIDGWSIPIWVAGAVCLLFGWRIALWSWPSLAFMMLMVPLPYTVERMFRLPLQRVATKLSTLTLQTLGQPALSEGNVVFLGEHQLEIAEACSGLRIFMTIVAVAFVYLIMVRTPWWTKIALVASTLPIALIANSQRIVMNGMIFQYFTISPEGKETVDHYVGIYFMIPLAACLFLFVLWYLNKLVVEVEAADISSVVRRQSRMASEG
jgi:exosortase